MLKFFAVLTMVFTLFNCATPQKYTRPHKDKGPRLGPFFLFKSNDKLVSRISRESKQFQIVFWTANSKRKIIEYKKENKLVSQAVLSGLKKGDSLSYFVKSHDWKSKVYTLTTPKTNKPLKVIITGDVRPGWGEQSHHKLMSDLMLKEKAHIYILLGDIVHHGNELDLWEDYFSIDRELLRQTVFIPVIGNHDISYENNFNKFFGLTPLAPYFQKNIYGLPIVGLETTREFEKNDFQLRLMNQFSTNNSTKLLPLIFGHHPVYSNGKHGPRADLIKFLVPHIKKLKLPVYFAGHDHNYQRFEPIEGTQYIITGGGGSPLYAINKRAGLATGFSIPHYLRCHFKAPKLTCETINQSSRVADRFEILLKPSHD